MRNLSVGDIMVLHVNSLVPTKWPLGKVLKTIIGDDDLVHVVIVNPMWNIYKARSQNYITSTQRKLTKFNCNSLYFLFHYT